MEERNIKKKIIIIIALGIVVLALGIGGVYAYFAASITQDTTSNVSISAVSGLAISFSHSPNLEIENALPGQSWTKTFSATLTNNKTTIGVTYSINLKIENNTFVGNKGNLTFSLSGAENVTETPITKESGELPILQNKTIKGNINDNLITQSYTLTISYPNNATSVQTQGGEFNGYIYFTTTENNISGGIKLFNHEGTNTKTKSNLSIGDLIQIETEQFYVIPDDNGNVIDNNGKVRALAKYNLLVGNICTSSTECTPIIETTQGYGMQSARAIGLPSDSSYPRIGTIEFSNDKNVGTNCVSNLKTGDRCYTTYGGSLIEKYVNSYITELKKMNIENLSGDLLTYGEMLSLKKYYTGNNGATLTSAENLSRWDTSSTGLSKPTWLWNTTYWSKTNNGTINLFSVRSFGAFYDGNSVSDIYGGRYSWNYIFGVRPVIVF